MTRQEQDSELRRAVGSLEANVGRLIEGQQKIEQRVDRLLYAVIAVGGGVIATLMTAVAALTITLVRGGP